METVTMQTQKEGEDRIECHIQLLYNARTIAAQNLHIANANFEKNYKGEKSDAAVNNLLTAIQEYKKADTAYTKAL